MWAFLQKLCSRIFFPVAWTLFSLLLLCLPGREIPGNSFLEFEGIDKVAHVIIFGGMVLFWGFYVRSDSFEKMGGWRNRILLLVLASTLLGITIEFVQRYAIPNRSFDTGDILADLGGSAATGFFHLLWPVKNKKGG